MSKFYSKGAVLLVVLIFSMVVAIITTVILETGVLQIKMLNAYQDKLIALQKAEAELVKSEKYVEDNFELELPSNITFTQFVPDTLLYDEKQGTNFYQVETMSQSENGAEVKLSSTVAVRRKTQVQDPSYDARCEAILWKCALPAISLIQDPMFFKISNGMDAVILTTNHAITIYEERTGVKVTAFELPQETEISKLSVVDSKSRGYADLIYFGDSFGRLCKINLINNSMHFYQMPGILGQVLVGRHPNGLGALLYVRSKNAITALSDLDKPHFVIQSNSTVGQPLLRQGYLIFTNNGKIKIHDAFTGKWVSEQQLNMILIDEGNEPPQVTQHKPREQRREVTVASNNISVKCEMDVDYNRLGRRTWEELH